MREGFSILSEKVIANVLVSNAFYFVSSLMKVCSLVKELTNHCSSIFVTPWEIFS